VAVRGESKEREAWLRSRLEELERIDRPSASDGELEAAEWIVDRLGETGVEARIEIESAHGTYWWPIGIGTAAGQRGEWPGSSRGSSVPP